MASACRTLCVGRTERFFNGRAIGGVGALVRVGNRRYTHYIRVTSGREAEMSCTGCADANLIAIRMKIGAEDVVFRRCNRCEINQWATTEGEISLDEVLELARTGK